VQLCLDEPPGEVRVAVRDRGPGIAPAFRARLFEKFAQAEGADLAVCTGDLTILGTDPELEAAAATLAATDPQGARAYVLAAADAIAAPSSFSFASASATTRSTFSRVALSCESLASNSVIFPALALFARTASATYSARFAAPASLVRMESACAVLHAAPSASHV
jgi:hypothetical protein